MPKLLRAARMEECIACGSCMLACARRWHQSLSLEKSAIRIRTAGGFRSSPVADVCLGCIDPACASVCPAGALVARAGGGVLVRKDRCIGCDRCTEVCSVHGIRYDDELGYPVTCVHCGTCVHFCPHGCLVLENVDAAGVPTDPPNGIHTATETSTATTREVEHA